MKRREHRFMVGYTGDWQTVYGRRHGRDSKFADPMTLRQAERFLLQLGSPAEKAIYELVPFKIVRSSGRQRQR